MTNAADQMASAMGQTRTSRVPKPNVRSHPVSGRSPR